jgi:hypothetical protein
MFLGRPPALDAIHLLLRIGNQRRRSRALPWGLRGSGKLTSHGVSHSVLRESDNAGYGLPAFPLQLCRYNAGLLKERLISIERRVGWNNQRGDLNTD